MQTEIHVTCFEKLKYVDDLKTFLIQKRKTSIKTLNLFHLFVQNNHIHCILTAHLLAFNY